MTTVHPGTRTGGLDALLSRVRESLADGFLPLQVFNDADVYDAELERVFGRSWVFLAHETEIPNPGDYVLRRIGEDPFIVSRGNDGQIRAFFNSCRHRGTQVCRYEKGNSNSFRCPFHGWTYNNLGNLTGVPSRAQAYPQMDLADWSLHQAPKVDTYHGLVFACLDPEAVPLSEYIGDMGWYLDTNLLAHPDGLEVIGEPLRWNIEANWKLGAETFCGDSYHLQHLHRSVFEVGLVPQFRGKAETRRGLDVHVSECSGHATVIIRGPEEARIFWGSPDELKAQYRQGELSDAQFSLARRSIFQVGTVFPNFSFMHTSTAFSVGGVAGSYFIIRQWQPKGPNRVEAWNWTLVPRGLSEEAKQIAHRAALSQVGPSGNFEAEDSVVWEGITRVAGSAFARRIGAKLHYAMGLDDGSAQVMEDFEGPGTVYDTRLEDGVQRTLYRRWLQEISRGDGTAV
ncbi:aromatic ring-hydroxylating dioxygenase subunit alpha [Rugosimonospora acidiphila]|uniref:Aromatic ring-hydroxylating dioxygenase subunit alpha n=1 Tax=Rugosimonospora acidiphila TaxID=556531 RepID=A0ABP9S423_9ACTN